MTGRATRTRQAEDDFAEIVAYIAAAALKLAGTLKAKDELLARFPGLGRPYPRRQARIHPVGNYLIIYRETPDGIEVLRYLHGGRNLAGLL